MGRTTSSLVTQIWWLAPFPDFLGEIVGGGRYDDLLPKTVELRVFGQPCRVVSLHCLITLKRAAERPKDLEAIAELEILSEEQE